MQNTAGSYWQFFSVIVLVLVHSAKAGSSSLFADAAELLLDVLCAISLRIVDKKLLRDSDILANAAVLLLEALESQRRERPERFSEQHLCVRYVSQSRLTDTTPFV